MTAMTLSPMIGMNGDLVNQSTGRAFTADEDANRVGAREGDHAAAAPDLKIADRPLERGRRHGRLAGKVRRPAAIQRVDEKRHIVRAAKTVRRHINSISPRSGSRRPSGFPERALVWPVLNPALSSRLLGPLL